MNIYDRFYRPYLEDESSLELLDQTTHNKGENDATIVRMMIEEQLKNLENLSEVSGFTLTLRQKYHEIDDLEMHRYIHKKILKSRVWKNLNYIIIPEYTAKGALHYHGVIYDSWEFNVMRCIKWWRREFGFAKPELKLKSVKNWVKYIQKDRNKTGLWTIYNFKEKINIKLKET